MSSLINTSKTNQTFWVSWAVAVGTTLLLLVLATLPPLLGETGRALVMEAFAPFCHQLPDYSPHISGVQLAVGHRMYGILWGLVLGTLAFPGLFRWDEALDQHAAMVLGVAAAPMTLDWTLNATGWWDKTPISRLATGIVFGIAAGYFLARAVVNLFASTPAEKRPAPSKPTS